MSKSISKHEEKFQTLIKEYKEGNIEVLGEIKSILFDHVFNNLLSTGHEVSKEVANLLIDHILTVRLNGEDYLRPILDYSNQIITSSKRIIDSWKLDKNSDVNDVSFRICQISDKKITNTSWAYDKIKEKLKEGISIDKFLKEIFDLTYNNILELTSNNKRWKSLEEIDITDAVVDAINYLGHKAYKEKTLPEYFYQWSGCVNRKIIYKLGKKKETIIKNYYLDDGETQRIVDINTLKNVLKDDDSPMTNCCNLEKKEQLNELLKELKPKQREVMELRHQDGLSYGEIAQKLNYSRTYCVQLEVQALKKLRKILSERVDLNNYFSID